jgi:transcriptional regulator with XRE-family HTH domain
MTVTKGGMPTGTSAGGVSEYAPPAPSETRALSLRADYLRTEFDMLGGEMQEIHGEIREHDLADRTLEKSKKSAASLLKELAGDRGMGWSDIAEVAGVSVSAIRKWRKGGVASPQSRSKLTRLAALLDVLEEKGLIEDPAAWMEMDFSLAPGYFIRPLDLYLEGHVTELIELAEQRQTAAQMLDRVRPNWRQSRSDFEVFLDADGERSIRRRDD